MAKIEDLILVRSKNLTQDIIGNDVDMSPR